MARTFHFVRRAVFRSRSDEVRDVLANGRGRVGRHVITGNPSSDRLAAAWFWSRMEGGGRGRIFVARRVLRLVAFAMLFLLALVTGMLLPASWVLRF